MAKKNEKPKHTPNGFSLGLIDEINGILEDRGNDLRITDLTQPFWDHFIGPMIDSIEDGTPFEVPAG